MCGYPDRSDQSVTSAAFLSVVHRRPESQKVVRPGGSQRGSQLPRTWPFSSPADEGVYSPADEGV